MNCCNLVRDFHSLIQPHRPARHGFQGCHLCDNHFDHLTVLHFSLRARYSHYGCVRLLTMEVVSPDGKVLASSSAKQNYHIIKGHDKSHFQSRHANDLHMLGNSELSFSWRLCKSTWMFLLLLLLSMMAYG